MYGKRLTRALVATTIASLVIAVAAFADTVIVTNAVLVNTNVTKAPGSSGTGYVRLDTTNGTPAGDENGCNAPGSDPLTVNLASDNAGVTLASSAVLVAGCGTDVPFNYSVSASASGTATISVSSYSGGKTDGTRLYSTSDTLVITISGPSCTAPSAPTIDVTGGTAGGNGWYTAAPSLSSTPSSGVQWATAVNGGAQSAFSSTVPTLGIGTTIVYAKAVSGTCESTEVNRTFKVDPNAPTIADDGFIGGTAGSNGWFISAVTNQFSATDGTFESGFAAGFTNPWQVSSGTNEGSGVTIPSGQVSDVAGNTAPSIDSAPYDIDLTDPTVTCNAAAFILNQPSAQVTAAVSDDQSGPASSTASAAANTSAVGTFSVNVTGYDIAGRSKSESCSYTVGYNFDGLYAPVDRPNTLNVSKAGQAIPLKWRLTDYNGFGVTNLTGVTVGVGSLSCSSTATLDTVEEYAGTSGLQNLGDGYYQFNWKTPTSYANLCKSLSIKMGTASDAPVYGPLANFQFKK